LNPAASASETTQLAMLNKTTHTVDQQPASIWDLPASDRYVIVAELEKGILRVFEKSSGTQLREIKNYPITIGKQGFGKTQEGDERTPVGVYRITSQLNDQQLDDFYGHTAYPLNYPNAWDRLNQYTGSGIWLHGVEDDSVKRPLRDSDGCIVLSNADLEDLGQYLNVGYTKVLGVKQIQWVSNAHISRAREQLTERMQQWTKAWESRDPEQYLAFYSENFSDTEKDYAQWTTYKRRVNTNKRYIRVRLSDLGIYAYPGQENTVMAEFYQDYASNSYRSRGWKRQLWRLESDGQWRIIYEKGG
ncbi:MAG: L,D-transpeptidase family protein, partial [Pseudomonadota bacterium]|nr:L,D-transpeptidase family protein [Pseudomonadota bacterium]